MIWKKPYLKHPGFAPVPTSLHSSEEFFLEISKHMQKHPAILIQFYVTQIFHIPINCFTIYNIVKVVNIKA